MEFHLNVDDDRVQEALSSYAPVCVEPHHTVAEVLELMKDARTGSALVLRDGKVAGIYTERDALRMMANGAAMDAVIESVMVSEPITVKEGDTLASAIKKMSDGGHRRLPVVDDAGRPVNSIRASNILRYLVEHFPQEIYNLPPGPDQANKEREGA